MDSNSLALVLAALEERNKEISKLHEALADAKANLSVSVQRITSLEKENENLRAKIEAFESEKAEAAAEVKIFRPVHFPFP